jgi:hypothetical protein
MLAVFWQRIYNIGTITSNRYEVLLSFLLQSPCTADFPFLSLQSPWFLTLCSSVLICQNGQSASLSWNKAPIWGLRPDFYYSQTVAGLLMWGALSDERTGLTFTIASDPRQRSHFRVRVPWDSWPYFTVSDLRLPFSSPPTTRRAKVEVSDPASTRDCTELQT